MQDLHRRMAITTRRDLDGDEEFDEESPLSREVQMEPLPLNFKEPHKMLYDGAVYKWFKRLEPGTITSWKQLSDEFLQQHQTAYDNIMPVTSITNVKQKREESLGSYLQHFHAEVTKVGKIKFAIVVGVYPGGRLWRNMLKRELDDLDNFYERAKKYICMEEGDEVLRGSTSECSLGSSSNSYMVY
uniref:Retrotransposon gag domain-containing protein n=1 Tax=Cannabis sativa TaxID=3483 RepID=A0A803QA32_CANSA